MDGDEDSLSSGSELAEEADDVEGGLAVEPRGGLVKEEQQLGLGSELDSNGDPLARLHAYPIASAERRRRRDRDGATHRDQIQELR